MTLPTHDHPPSPAFHRPPEECPAAEARLIERLCRERRLTPGDFVRGHKIGPYTLALYCPAARLAFEIDAGSPPGTAEQSVLERTDASALRRMARDSFLQSVGVEVLRVPEDELESTERLEALVVRIGRRIEGRMRAQREREQAGRTPEAASGYGAPASGSSLA